MVTHYSKKMMNYYHITKDNVLIDKVALPVRSLRNFKYELLEHPLYSPDLPPSDFYKFISISREFLARKHTY